MSLVSQLAFSTPSSVIKILHGLHETDHNATYWSCYILTVAAVIDCVADVLQTFAVNKACAQIHY
jgi:hypothetical protein